jgi:protease IV
VSLADAETILERRQLKRRLLRWRMIAAAAIVLAVAALMWQASGVNRSFDHVARITIEGLITGDQPTLDLLDQLAKADHVKGVIVRIDSPGGTTAGSEAIYDKIRKIAEKKPVASVMDTVAASGGYITAIATDYIVARGNTITGSIGVIFSFPQFSELLAKIGVRMEEIKSGELKAEPTPYKPMSEHVRQVTNEMVQEAFGWFMGLVSERRKLPLERVRVLADGRVYSGRQAVAEKLIDALGGEEEAIAWMETAKAMPKSLKVLDWKRQPEQGTYGLGFAIADRALEAFGLNGLRRDSEAARLDGLLALWHP